MTSKIRHRTIGAFLALSGLMSYLMESPSFAQSAPDSLSTTSAAAPHSEPSPTTPAPTTFSGMNVIDFGNHDGGHFSLTGDLINNGTIYAISTNPSITTAIFSAPNIFNQTGATISSVLPAGGLPGYGNAVAGLNLIFNTTNNFINAGIVNSAGSLAINAGGSITNALPQGVMAPPPVMQAINNIDIASQIGNIVNAGTIASMTGNINITAAANNALAINNLGGIISALQGNINVRDALYTGTAQMNIAGGDWLSKNLNLMNGQGAITAQLNSATGVLNAYGYGANVGVWKGDLNLGVLKADGDPTYYSADGDITLGASTIGTDGFDLAIIAKGNVYSASDLVINTSDPLFNGPSGNVLIVAGAKFITPTSGEEQPAPTINFLKVTFTSPNPALDPGGSILPSGALQIDTSGDLAGNPNQAGNVTLIAYQGKSPDSGQIAPSDVSNSYVRAVNSPGFSGGSVTMIAGATTGTAISFGNVTGGGGNAAVNIYAATPVISGGGGQITVINGTVQPGSGSYIRGDLQLANISLGDLNNDGFAGIDGGPALNGANGGAFQIQTLGDLAVNSIYSRGGKGGADTGALLGSGGVGGNGGTISIQGAAVQALLVDVTGGDGGFGGDAPGGVASPGGAGGGAGSFKAVASTSIISGNLIAKGGTGGNGGTGGAIWQPDTTDNSGGAGGSVTLSAPDIAVNDVDISGGKGGVGIITTLFATDPGNALGGGNGGSFIATATATFQSGGSITATGGAAGTGGAGNGFDGNVLAPGGKGGSIQITGGTDVTVGLIDTTGGGGGTVPFSNDFNPGNPSNGGDGGSIVINAGTSLTAFDSFLVNGGDGADGGSSNISGWGTNGSNGGNAGIIRLSGTACCLSDLFANGGKGGNAGNGAGVTGGGGNGGNGGSGGSISINASEGVNVQNMYANSGTFGAGGTGQFMNGTAGTGSNGGSITLTNVSTDLMNAVFLSGELTATGIGAGNKGGSINLSVTGTDLLAFGGPITANGEAGADGGSITLSALTPNTVILTNDALTATADGGGNGGAINITAPEVTIGFGQTGRSLDVSSTVSKGGTINVTTTGLTELSNGCGCNSVLGAIVADGVTAGGRINLNAVGGFNFESGIRISADASSADPLATGGLIQFTQPGSTTINFENDTDISARNAANTSGRIGFNAGPNGGVNISGFGTLTAGEFVGLGNLNPATLDVINPLEVQLSDFPLLFYSLVQNGVSNKIIVSLPVPPTSPPGTTLTGSVSKEVVIPLQLPQAPSNSTITNIDQTPFIVSLADVKLLGNAANPSTYIDGVFVSAPADAIGAKGLSIAPGENGGLVLSRGNMLLAPPATATGGMEIVTQEGTLTIAPGAMAFLIETGNDVAVYALNEGQRGDITFRSGKHSIDLSTGQQAVFSRNTTDFFSKVNPGGLIPARQVNEYKLDNGVKAFIAEYSIPMALSIIKPLKAVRQSDNPELRKVASAVQKNAAIMSLIGTRFGPYKGLASP